MSSRRAEPGWAGKETRSADKGRDSVMLVYAGAERSLGSRKTNQSSLKSEGPGKATYVALGT